MTAASITQRLADYLHLPNVEAVVVTASDTNTFVSEKFSTVLGAGAFIMEDDERDITTAVSAATVTINSTGLSSKKVLLILFGIK